MYSLGIPERQFRRTTQVLGPEASYPIEFNSLKQNDGFYLFTFPNIDEYDFRDIVMLLKNNGVTTIGADDTLTERNIMKLTDLLKEQGSPDENNLFDELTLWLEKVRANEPISLYGGDSIAREKNERTNQYELDIEQMLENFSEDLGQDQIAMDVDSAKDMQENQGLNKMNRDMTPEEEYLKDNPSPGTSSPMNTQSGEFDIEVPVQNEDTKVKIKYGHATGPVDEVTISWGNESHTVTFEEEDVIDDHGNEGKDMTFVAYSEDDKWRFIVDVSVGFNYEDSGEIQDVDWNTLEIDIDDSKKDDPRMDPAIRSDFDDPIMERMKKLAGIRNK